ncbi:hypothetical protein GOP47_0025473 [Adiantum capillus-veneris]|uniref:Uncharacterized protein n=1 Tax=Adiantum capillus-veneris TaxID=13818 RepID=A0A9D4Z308_ADICA|nr:hypothetical protein GOP47_0025473 [Adiantum capillus-veneris]
MEGLLSQPQNAAPVDPHRNAPSPPMVPLEAGRTSQTLNAMPVEPGRPSHSLNAAPVDPHCGLPSLPMVPMEASRTSQTLNAIAVEPGRPSQSLNAAPEKGSHINTFPEESHPSKSLNMMSMDATYNLQSSPVDVRASALHNMVPVEVSRTSKSLNVMPVELERASQLLLVPAEASDDDVRTIKEVLSVHHVPVVASLHWEKLHTILHTLCDRIAIQALRIEKAEEQGKTFLGFKDELDQLCRNCVKEMKVAKESEVEQQQKWSSMVEERLELLKQGVDENNNSTKQLGDSISELQSLNSKLQTLDTQVQSLTPRLDALEEGSKNFDRLDALEEAVKSTDAVQSSQLVSLETLNQKVEELLLDFEEQNEKLHTLEEQTEQLKLKLEQTTNAHASDLDAVQQYCRNLRSDFEMKFIVDVGKHPTAEEEELSEASRAKIEAAVAELQNRIQKKADVDDLERITQSTQNVKDACEKMESNMIELQLHLKRLSAGSRRASRVSLTGSLVPPSLLTPESQMQLQMLMPQTKLNSLEDLSPQLLDELTKDLKDAIEKHNKELEKVQKDFGLFGRSILKLSGHQEERSKPGATDPADKLVKIFEGFGDGSPLLTPSSDDKPVNEATSTSNLDKKQRREGESTSAPNDVAEDGPDQASIKKDVLVGTVDLMDDDAVVQAIDEALKANKFEPKENSKTIARLCQELEKLTLRLQELDTVMPTVKDALALKAEKRDLQKLARFVKEQLERPENAIFTGKPLYGFKCMSCDHSIEMLSRVTGDHKPTNRMPPQILPMLSAERIFSLQEALESSSQEGGFDYSIGSAST